jgi:hypothetical protein
MSGFAARFAVEVAFLVLLAVGAGFADLRAWIVVAVMAAGWLLVTLIEALAWRADRDLQQRVGAATPRPAFDAGSEQPEPRHGWDVEEILAPLPEEEPSEQGGDALTSVIPPEEAEQ